MIITEKEATIKAFNAYDRGKVIFAKLSKLAKQIIPNFPDDKSLIAYDYLIQGILVRVGVSDGYFLDSEKQLILKLSSNGDILSRYNLINGKDNENWNYIHWEDIRFLSHPEKEGLASKLLDIADKYLGYFIKAFAVVDSSTGVNFLQEIENSMSEILLYFSAVDGDDIDGDSSATEISIGSELFGQHLKSKWIAYKKA